jgi:hypothetical protein
MTRSVDCSPPDATDEVSDRGRVRSLDRVVRPTVGLPGRGTVRVHVLVCETFIGPRPDGLLTRHLNGNPYDNRIENLAYGTVSENSLDCVSHGTHPLASKTHCKRGHEFTEGNFRWVRGGTSRECISCVRIRRPKPKGPRTHCKRGHEFTPENTLLDKRRPGRACKTCTRAGQKIRNAKRYRGKAK